MIKMINCLIFIFKQPSKSGWHFGGTLCIYKVLKFNKQSMYVLNIVFHGITLSALYLVNDE